MAERSFRLENASLTVLGEPPTKLIADLSLWDYTIALTADLSLRLDDLQLLSLYSYMTIYGAYLSGLSRCLKISC